MIKYQKTNPIGIDYFITRFQILQQRYLPGIFGVSESLCLFYGRAELLSDDNAEVPIIFTAGNKYEKVGIDTKYNFISYITLTNISADSKRESADASLYCHGNLANLFSSTTHRADHELRTALKTFVLSQIEPQDFSGIEVLNSEMQPFHSFKITFKINF